MIISDGTKKWTRILFVACWCCWL